MKRLLSFLAAFLLIEFFPFQVWAYDGSVVAPSGQRIYYNYDSINNSIIITYPGDSYPFWSYYSKPTGHLVIPDSIIHNGITYPVTSIGRDAFSQCTNLTSITIPNTVTKIEYGAISGCSGLTSVTIPNSVKTIGVSAFSRCTGLTSVTIGRGVDSIGNYAFKYCGFIDSIMFNADSCVFAGSWWYDYNVFSDCNYFTFGENVKVIPAYLCSGMSSLTSIIIPNTVVSIGNNAFSNSGLISVFFNVDICGNVYYYSYDSPFYNCPNITNFTFGDSVKIIPNYLCSGLSNLSYVTIGKNVRRINSAFGGCTGLTTVMFNADSCVYGDLGYGCTNITNFVFGNNVKMIPPGICSGQDSLTSIIIPDSVTVISSNAFQNCSNLSNIDIPNSVTHIGASAFSGCSSLTSVSIPNSVTRIGNSAFENCISLTYVSIPNSVNSIGNDAFYNCSGLISVTIPNSVTSIGERVFSGCSGLTSVTIPNSVTSIGGWTFYNCSGLTSVTIPSSVTAIGSSAFYNCSGIASVNYTGTIAQWCGINFSTEYSNPIFYSHTLSIDGYPLTNLVIPEGVTEIKYCAFYNCSGLTSVTIGDSVTSIGAGAFIGCSGLTSVTIGNSVTSIGGYAFGYCSGLTEITSLAMTAPSLGSSVFSGVSSAIPIYIPCGSLTSYQTAWNHFSNFLLPPSPYNISVGITDSTFGASNITEGPTCDSMAVIEATANYGYHFTQWSDGNTDNPRIITLTQDTTLTAYFDRNEYQLTLNSVDSTLGTVIGSGTYLYLDTVHIVANAIEHHHLVHWSDGDNNAIRNIVIIADLELTATFAIDTFTVSATAADLSRGTVTGSGMYSYNSPCVLLAIPYAGYVFSHWSDGSTANPYAFPTTEDVTLTAVFLAPSEITYTVTATSANPTMGNVTGGGNYNNGTTATLTAIPATCYHFTSWSNGLTTETISVTVASDSILVANFERNEPLTGDTTAIACDSYTWYGEIYTTSATPTHNLLTVAGCDSTVTLNLTVNHSSMETDVQVACESYFFDGQWIYTSGQYMDTLTNTAGCDSIVTMNLTINNPVHIATTEEACDSYTWQEATITVSGDYTYPHDDANGCTQVDTLHLTIYYSVETTVTDTAEESYTWNGTTYTESGTYQWLGQTAEGCDSTVTLNLTVTHVGIEDVENGTVISISVLDGHIIVNNSGVGANNDLPVRVYDVTGRQYPTFTSHVSPFTLPDGVYLVKVGNHPARRVVVIR